MSRHRFREPLCGIVPPVVTPLLDRDTLDVAGLERVLEHILTGGVSGLFLLGTTGEAQGLSYRLRREVIERACRQVAGRVPVLVGITDTAFVESVGLARLAADSGADAVVVAPPYYICRSASRSCRNISIISSLICRCRCFSTTSPRSPRSPSNRKPSGARWTIRAWLASRTVRAA